MSDIKVGVGNYSIILNEDIMHRLDILKDCQYMKDDLNKVIDTIIELYNEMEGIADLNDIKKCMQMISTLHEAQKDYAFLSSLIIENELQDVFGEAADEE